MEEPSPATAKDSVLNRRRNFGETYEAFQAHATSLVGLTRQFKELQARWGSTENELRTRFRYVGVREKELEEKEAKSKMEMEAQQKELESSKYQLLSLKPLIVRHEQELHVLRETVSQKKKEVDLIDKRCLDYDAKLNSVEKCVEEKTRELEKKEKECELIENRAVEKKKEVDLIHEKLKSVEECVVEKTKELEKKERELSVISESMKAKRKCIEELDKEMEMKRGQIDAKEILVREKRKEYELIENRVVESHTRCYYFERCVEEMKKEFECKEKELKEVQGLIQLKRRELDGILMSLHENMKECDLREKKVMALEETIRKCEKEMELNREEWSRQTELKEMELESLFGKFELRGKQFEPVVEEIRDIDKRWEEWLNEGLVKEGSLDSASELKMKERQIEEGAKQLKLKQMQFSSEVKTQLLEREKHLASLNSSLQQQEQSMDALHESIEEVKKLLERQFEQQGRVIGLEQKQTDAQLLEREEQLALLGKSIEECEKQFKGFQKLLQEQRLHLDSLCHRLHLRERQVEEQGKELALNLKHTDCVLSTACLELPPAADDMIIHQCVCDQPNINKDGRSFEVIPGIIRNLIERKQLIKAVTFICTFKQIQKFPPVPILKEFVEDARKSCTEFLSTEISHDVKEKIVDDVIADLRAVIKCIEDHRLESQYPPIDIVKEIQGLGELKENLDVVLSLPSNVKKQGQRKRKKQSSSISPITSHTYQLRKRT